MSPRLIFQIFTGVKPPNRLCPCAADRICHQSAGGVVGLNDSGLWGQEVCNFPRDSCKFPTKLERFISARNFNLSPYP